MSDQDLDKLFENTLSDVSLPFDEGAWASAEKAIIAHEAAKRRRGIIVWFLAGLLLLSGGLGIYQINRSRELAGNIQSEPKNESQISLIEKQDSKVKSESPKNENSQNVNLKKPDDSNNGVAPTESGNFASNYEQPNYGQTENLPPLVLTTEIPKSKDEIYNSDNVENKAVAQNRFLAKSIALRFADQLETSSAESYNESAGRAGELNLPEHWNSKVNLIAGVLPLDYSNSGESGINRLPYYAGIGISKIYNYSWEYGAAILFEELVYSENEKTIEQTEYGFGRTTTRHSIQRQRGNYLSIPLYAKYRIKNNHAFMAGLQYSRLMQSYSSYSIEKEDDYLNTLSTDEQSNVSGFNKDLSKNQVSLIIGYDLTLSDRLRLQVLGRLGGNSLYRNEINKNSFSDRVHLRIGIEYSLWRF